MTARVSRRAFVATSAATSALLAAMAACSPAPAPIGQAPPDTVVATLSALVGESEGAPEVLFGRIVGVARTPAGVLYVADDIGSSVRAYDPAGAFLGTVGEEGEGPGEFTYLVGIDLSPVGQLHVRGAFRVTSFEVSSGGLFADSVAATFPLGPRGSREVRGESGDDRYYAPGYVWEDFQMRGYYYEVYEGGVHTGDTISVPPFPDPETTGRANYPVTGEGFGINVDGINRAPFEARPSWDITASGDVFMAPGDAYEVVHTGPAGDTVQVIRIARPALAVPDEERRDSARAFFERLDSVPVPLSVVRGMSDMARRRELPSTLPQILEVQVDDGGDIWLRRWSAAVETVYDVLDGTGTPLRTVRIPLELRRSPAPWLSPHGVAGVVADPVTGVERVAVFTVGGP